MIEIHRDMIERYGGSFGIRDEGLLESAVAMPQAGFGEQYLHSSVFEMAAAYLFHIVKNHPFVDGNKRTGAMAAFTFLKLNQQTLNAGEVRFERLVRAAAEGKLGKEKIAEFFQKNSKSAGEEWSLWEPNVLSQRGIVFSCINDDLQIHRALDQRLRHGFHRS